MTDINRKIAELEAEIARLKKARPHGNKGKRRSDEQRAKMSAASKAALADPAVRAKMSAASKAAWADPAVRAKMSAASKAAWAEKHEREMQPKRKREQRKGLGEIQADPFEQMLFRRRAGR